MTVSVQETKEFETEVNSWMRENKPATPGFILPETFMEVGTDQQFEYLRDWQNKVHEADYVDGWQKSMWVAPAGFREYRLQSMASHKVRFAKYDRTKLGRPADFAYGN